MVLKLEVLRRRVISATQCNSRIVKGFPGRAGIPIGKLPSVWKNTPTASVRGTASRKPKLAFTQVHNFKEEGIAGFPMTTRTLKIDVGSHITVRTKIDGRKGTMLKISQFSPGEVAFALRFFQTHCDLTRKSITLRKKTRSDTTCNSRIIEFFPGQARILIGKRPSD